PGELVVDPFAGCGTTLTAATRRGHKAIGFEPHPIFYKMALAKLPTAQMSGRIEEVQDAILPGLPKPATIHILSHPARSFLGKLYPRQTLESLLGARESLRSVDGAPNELAFLILSKVLDESSHSQTDGIYKAPTSLKGAIAPADSCRRIVQMIRQDLALT